MAGLLGFLAAGAARQHAAVKNQETETRNRVGAMIIQQELQEMYQARRDERMAAREEVVHQRDVARRDVEYSRGRADKLTDEERERGYKKEDFQMSSEHDFKKMEVQHGHAKSLEGMRQEGLEKRASMRSQGLLNRSRDDFSNKELSKANESDRKRIFDLKKEMQSPLEFNNTEQKGLLEEEIKRLQFNINDREALMKYGNAPLDLDILKQ